VTKEEVWLTTYNATLNNLRSTAKSYDEEVWSWDAAKAAAFAVANFEKQFPPKVGG
jgi:hypothetical protein